MLSESRKGPSLHQFSTGSAAAAAHKRTRRLRIWRRFAAAIEKFSGGSETTLDGSSSEKICFYKKTRQTRNLFRKWTKGGSEDQNRR